MTPLDYKAKLLSESCHFAKQQRWYELASHLGEISLGTMHGLFQLASDDEMLLAEFQKLTVAHSEAIRREQSQEASRLLRILSYGGSLEFEEWVQVVTMCAMLSFTEKCIGSQAADVSPLIEALRGFGPKDTEMFRVAMLRSGAGFWKELRDLWWQTA